MVAFIVYILIGFIYSYTNSILPTYWVILLYPIEWLIKLVNWIQRKFVYTWMDRCDLMRPHIRRLLEEYLHRKEKDITWPEFVEQNHMSGYLIEFIQNKCLLPAISIFRLKNTAQDWERAFWYCIRTKRK
jgi:hypothetical protein